jgi:hypothetical protein
MIDRYSIGVVDDASILPIMLPLEGANARIVHYHGDDGDWCFVPREGLLVGLIPLQHHLWHLVLVSAAVYCTVCTCTSTVFYCTRTRTRTLSS